MICQSSTTAICYLLMYQTDMIALSEMHALNGSPSSSGDEFVLFLQLSNTGGQATVAGAGGSTSQYPILRWHQ